MKSKNKHIVNTLLTDKGYSSVKNIKRITSGKTSEAYSFESNNENYILRFNSKFKNFQKDKYCYENFNSRSVPIPKIIEIGKISENNYFSISEMCDGQIMDNIPDDVIPTFHKQILDLAFNIRGCQIRGNSGYGELGGDGIAKHKSWNDFLLSVRHNYQDLEGKKKLSIYKKLYQKIEPLTKYCPEEKHLIFGDFGLNNILADKDKITGIIDWADAMYGDFVYDIAWISFWSASTPYQKMFLDYYNKKNIPLPNYEKRIFCYTFHFGINILIFLEETKDKKTFDWVTQRLLTYL